jgi:hypothetical protein
LCLTLIMLAPLTRSQTPEKAVKLISSSSAQYPHTQPFAGRCRYISNEQVSRYSPFFCILFANARGRAPLHAAFRLQLKAHSSHLLSECGKGDFWLSSVRGCGPLLHVTHVSSFILLSGFRALFLRWASYQRMRDRSGWTTW